MSDQPLPGQFQRVTVGGTGRVFAALAHHHLRAATLLRDHVVRLEAEHMGQEVGAFFEDVRAYGSACIMSSAASLEALINELFIAHYSKLRAQFRDFETEFWGSRGKRGIEGRRILDKYQLALTKLHAPVFDEHTSPFRDARGLVELRNALVHFKPNWDTERTEREADLAEVLEGRFALSPFPDEGADFVTLRCMSAGCVTWAVKTVVAFVDEFALRTQLDAKKLRAFTQVGT